MRSFVLLALLFAGPLMAAAPATSARRELAEMKKQLAALTSTVQKLEARLEAKEKGAGEAAPSPSPSAAPANDPLAAAEAEVASAAASAARNPQPAAPTDVLSAAERDIAGAKFSAPTGNPRTAFNPQISAIGDFVYRGSSIDEDPAAPDANGTPRGDRNRDRFSLRELELGFQAAIDPFARADIFISIPDLTYEGGDEAGSGNGIELEEGTITYWRLPYGMQLKGGKFRLEFGKNNREHNDSQHAVERPLTIQSFFGPEGIAEQGLSLVKFWQLGGPETQLEGTVQLVNGEGGEETLFAGVGSDKSMALGRLRFYHDFSTSANIDIGTTYLGGHHDPSGRFHQRLHGVDATFRYEPVTRLVYNQLVVRGEYITGRRRVPVDLPIDVQGPDLDGDGISDPDGIDDMLVDEVRTSRQRGGYIMAQYFWDRFWNVGARYDRTDAALRNAALSTSADPLERDRAIAGLDRTEARSIWFTYFTSEFNRMRLQYVNSDTNFPLDSGRRNEDLLLLQWIFAMGPHGAHKY